MLDDDINALIFQLNTKYNLKIIYGIINNATFFAEELHMQWDDLGEKRHYSISLPIKNFLTDVYYYHICNFINTYRMKENLEFTAKRVEVCAAAPAPITDRKVTAGITKYKLNKILLLC